VLDVLINTIGWLIRYPTMHVTGSALRITPALNDSPIAKHKLR